MISLLNWLPPDTLKTITIGFVFVALAFPGSFLLGLVVGTVLPRVRAKQWLCYCVLLWPTLELVASYAWLVQIESSTSPQFVLPLWKGRVQKSLVEFVIYSLFFVTVFVSYKIVSRGKTHNPLFNSDARQETPRAG
jgi:hypothetical protein